MKTRILFIGHWRVEVHFADDGYDIDEIMGRLFSLGANVDTMRRALQIMEEEEPNKGFTFPNPIEHEIIVVIGPTSSGDEFIDTLVHEIHHVAVAIAEDLGIDLYEETPAYIAGDSARELAEVICQLGCRCCHPIEV